MLQQHLLMHIVKTWHGMDGDRNLRIIHAISELLTTGSTLILDVNKHVFLFLSVYHWL